MKHITLLLLLSLPSLGFAQYKVELHPLVLEFQSIDVLSKVSACEDCNVPFNKNIFLFHHERPEFNNFQFGPQFKINSDSTSRFGFDLHLPIRKNTFNEYVVLDENYEVIEFFENKHVFWSFTPTLDVNLKLGNYKKGSSPTLIFGASYDLNLAYRRSFGYYNKEYPDYENFTYPELVDDNKANASGGGFNLRFGVGYDFIRPVTRWEKMRNFSLKLVYQHTMYNPFNTDYEFEGKKIYDNWETEFGIIAVSISARIFKKKTKTKRKSKEEDKEENQSEDK